MNGKGVRISKVSVIFGWFLGMMCHNLSWCFIIIYYILQICSWEMLTFCWTVADFFMSKMVTLPISFGVHSFHEKRNPWTSAKIGAMVKFHAKFSFFSFAQFIPFWMANGRPRSAAAPCPSRCPWGPTSASSCGRSARPGLCPESGRSTMDPACTEKIRKFRFHVWLLQHAATLFSCKVKKSRISLGSW